MITSSVIVRCRDKASSIGQTLDSLRAQTVVPEIVVVDSGSVDGTVDIARAVCDVVVEIDPGDFSYGGALNIGARHAGGQVCFALSAHCVPSSTRWVEWALEAYDDDAVAATAGLRQGPDGANLPGPTTYGLDDLALDRNPFWGLSNHASSWRREVWIEHPFDEHLEACEDLEWMWRVLRSGYRVTADPRLYVDGHHRRAEGLRSLFRRQYRERLALASVLDYEPIGGRRALREWWSSFPYPSDHPEWQRRFSPWRTTELLSEYVGDQVGARRRRNRDRRGPIG